MAVVPMKRLELFALRRDRKAILELLQRRGVVEVESTQASGEVFRQADTSQAQQELETQARLLEQAVELLDHTVPVKKGMLSFLAGRKPVTWEEYQRQGQEAPALLEQAREILRLGKQVTDSEAQAQRLEAQLETLKPWMTLDLPLDAKGTGSTRVFLGSFPQALEEGALKAQLAQRLPQVSGIEAEVLSCQAQQTCVFLVCLRQDAAQVEEALRSMGFTYPAVTSPLPPAQQAKALEEEIRGARKEREDALGKIAGLAPKREELLLAADYIGARAEKYQVLGELWQSPHTFCLAGYLPAKDAPGLVVRVRPGTQGERAGKPLYPAGGGRGAGATRGPAGQAEKQLLHRACGGRGGGVQPSQQTRGGPQRGDGVFLLCALWDDALRRGLRVIDGGWQRLCTEEVPRHGAEDAQDPADVPVLRHLHHGVGRAVWQLFWGRHPGDCPDLLPHRDYRAGIVV